MNQITIEGIHQIFQKSKEKKERLIRHDFIQNSLLYFLQKEGYDVIKEYEISYRSKYRSKKKFGKLRPNKKGRIDLYAYK